MKGVALRGVWVWGTRSPDAGVEIYASFRTWGADGANGSDLDDMNIFVVGSRIKFN